MLSLFLAFFINVLEPCAIAGYLSDLFIHFAFLYLLYGIESSDNDTQTKLQD